MLENIKIILVETTHPGNIGATARAMKNMGLQQLVLVAPRAEFPCQEVTARAAGADSILAQVQVVDNLSQAIADCHWVIGTSTQNRRLPLFSLDAEQGALLVYQNARHHTVAIVFGTERSGLTNEHLSHCQRQIIIPTNPDYNSLNLAQAVQVITYEVRKQALQQQWKPSISKRPHQRLAHHEELEQFYQHLQQTLIDIEFINPQVKKNIMPRLKTYL